MWLVRSVICFYALLRSERRPLKHRIVKKCILVPEFIWNNSEEFLLRSFELSLRRAEKLWANAQRKLAATLPGLKEMQLKKLQLIKDGTFRDSRLASYHLHYWGRSDETLSWINCKFLSYIVNLLALWTVINRRESISQGRIPRQLLSC